MKTVRLYGEMGRRFGREFVLDVKTPAEAICALGSQIKGFRTYLHEHAQDSYKVFVGGRNASHAVDHPCSDREVIRIAPVTQGAGAAARIVAGAALIFLSAGTASPMVMAGFSASAASMAGSIGISLVLGGVAQLLTSTSAADTTSAESAENTPSYNFSGAVNTQAQGHPVPLAYGRVICGSAVISAGIVTQ